MTKLWILSDIHLDYADWHPPPQNQRPNADLLIVAGDLTSRMERGVKWLATHFPDLPVLYTPGNHEAYGVDIDRTIEKARAASDGTNVTVLHDDVVNVCGLRVVATTLWTDFNVFGNPDLAMRVAQERMNDFRKIRTERYALRFRPIHALARHQRSLSFVEAQLRRPYSGDTVVISHHVPIRSPMLPPGDKDPVHASYMSDLSALITECGPKIWFFGHIHRNHDLMIGRTRLVSNPKGYGPTDRRGALENPDFTPTLVIDV